MQLRKEAKFIFLALFLSLIFVSSLFLVVKAGSLTPSGPIGSTMKSLQEVYDAIAGTFESNVFTGSGLDDMTAGGTFTGASALDYRIQIDAEGSPDTFAWSDDGGATWDAAGVAITGSAQALSSGVTVTFNAATGHTSGDRWDFSTDSLASTDGSVIQRLKYISGMTLQQIYNNSVSPVAITDSSAGAVLTIEQSGAGNIIELKDSASSVFSIDNLGNISMGASTLTSADSAQISSGGASDLVLNAGSGKIKAAAGDLFYVGDVPIAAVNDATLVGIVPIFGFDLPARTAATSYKTVTREIENYPFPAAATGKVRQHKFIIRYADSVTSGNSTWQVYNTTDSAQTSTFTVPYSASVSLDKGEVYITGDVAIPTDTDDWRLDVQVASGNIQIYDIQLAAYDVVD